MYSLKTSTLIIGYGYQLLNYPYSKGTSLPRIFTKFSLKLTSGESDLSGPNFIKYCVIYFVNYGSSKVKSVFVYLMLELFYFSFSETLCSLTPTLLSLVKLSDSSKSTVVSLSW